MGRQVNPEADAGDMDGFKEPTPDIYFVKIEECLQKTPNSGGNPYYNTEVRVLSGIDTGAEYANSRIWEILSTSEKATWKIAQAAVSCGIVESFDIDNPGEVENLFKGRIGKVQTKMDEYEGEKRCKIQNWLRMEADERAAFASAGGGGAGNSNLPSSPSSSSVDAAEPAGDKIPF